MSKYSQDLQSATRQALLNCKACPWLGGELIEEDQRLYEMVARAKSFVWERGEVGVRGGQKRIGAKPNCE